MHSFRLLFITALGAVTLAAQQSAAIFTAAQANTGRDIYERVCAGCHGVNFEGSGDAPALAGGTFLLKWRPKMVSELFGEILQSMPPTNPGSLGEASVLQVTAYILQRNGAQTGPQELTAGVATPIGAIATGQAPPGNAPAQGRGGRGGAPSMVLGAGSTAGQGRGGTFTTRGVSVPGEVKNYVPVTPAMLKNPPPEDWLIFGRNYQRHSYSPLKQITRDNVKNLQLKWIWAMNDSGANQTTPIVHNGVIYLASPSNIVQALSAKTGRSDLGNARGSGPGAGIRRHPQHRDRRRQNIPADQRCAHGGDRRAQREDSLGHAGVRQTACLDQRDDRDRRQGADGFDRLRAL